MNSKELAKARELLESYYRCSHHDPRDRPPREIIELVRTVEGLLRHIDSRSQDLIIPLRDLAVEERAKARILLNEFFGNVELQPTDSDRENARRQLTIEHSDLFDEEL